MTQTAYQEYVAECGDEGVPPIEQARFAQLCRTHPADERALEDWLYDAGERLSDERAAALTLAVRVFTGRINHWQRIIDTIEPWLTHVDALEDDRLVHPIPLAGFPLHQAYRQVVEARNRELAARRHFSFGLS